MVLNGNFSISFLESITSEIIDWIDNCLFGVDTFSTSLTEKINFLILDEINLPFENLLTHKLELLDIDTNLIKIEIRNCYSQISVEELFRRHIMSSKKKLENLNSEELNDSIQQIIDLLNF